MLSSLRRWIQRTLHPAWYQGRGQSPPYFEGWYFKIVDPTETYRYAIIAAIFKTSGAEQPHAFVQINDAVRERMTYLRYPVTAFRAAQKRFAVQIGPHTFSDAAMALNIATEELTLRGMLRFRETQPWPATWIAPGAMGWYAWAPWMECYQGVVSFDHSLAGALTLDGVVAPFTGGRGYIEKTWGHAFPQAWIWLQCNHFAAPGISLFGAISIIPWLRWSFRGFMIGLWHAGTLTRFATYTGAQTDHLAVTPSKVTWRLHDRRHRLELVVHRGKPIDLRGPSTVDMGVRVPEALDARIDIKLTRRRDGRVLLSDHGRNAGLEIGGNVARLLDY